MCGLTDGVDVVGYWQCWKVLRSIRLPGPGERTDGYIWPRDTEHTRFFRAGSPSFSGPRCSGDSFPHLARWAHSQMTMRIIQKSWMPEPSRELRIMGYWGGLKTSPCTSFHPDSSIVSSCSKGPKSETVSLVPEKAAPTRPTLTRAKSLRCQLALLWHSISDMTKCFPENCHKGQGGHQHKAYSYINGKSPPQIP